MSIAIDLAKESLAQDELPVGAVIVLGGQVIAKGRNRRESSSSKIAHAELEAIEVASRLLRENPRQATLYTTLEPCLMCYGAACSSKILRICYGAQDSFAGACHSVELPNFYQRFAPALDGGIMQEESLELLHQFCNMHDQRKWKTSFFGPAIT
ncbi:nucleoside deaminase [Ideonella sp. 3Y2]|uniref:Nucleoside deaminase n=2 Tax=Ideonella alba TaxID=2824118 RepID=A0A941BIV7_9BURK|nr:nucleoside deaminase [Ideonella alba]